MITLTDCLIVLLSVLVLSLDTKLWAKLDRVVAFVIMQKVEVLEQLKECAVRIENLEKQVRGKK